MQKTIKIAVLLLLVLSTEAQNGTDRLQQAQKKMQAMDFEDAIEIHDQILRDPSSDAVLAASARMDRAMAQDLLARSEAMNEYREVLDAYAGEAAVVESANKRISQVAPRPAIYIAEFDSVAARVHAPVTRFTDWGRSEQIPMWSPDGESLSFNRRSAAESNVVVRHIATQRDMFQEPQGAQLGPLFWAGESGAILSLRSGELLLVPSYVLPLMEPLARGMGRDLYRIDSRGTAKQISRFVVQITSFQSAISHDGKSLYTNIVTGAETFSTGALAIFDVATGQRKQVFSLPPDKALTAAVGPPAPGRYMSLSPDGNMLAMARRPQMPSSARLGIVNVNGDDYRDLVTGEGTLRIVTWTRDGQSILFTKLKPNATDTWLLMQIPAKGGDAVFTGLEITGLSYLDVSPDGKRIAFDGTAFRIEGQSR